MWETNRQANKRAHRHNRHKAGHRLTTPQNVQTPVLLVGYCSSVVTLSVVSKYSIKALYACSVATKFDTLGYNVAASVKMTYYDYNYSSNSQCLICRTTMHCNVS